MNARVIGVIADDVTGATDVAVAFRRSGLRTLIYFGVPADEGDLPEHDVLVIALKSRSIPSRDAVAQSLSALAWLREHDATQIYFKYCSTFDSTPEGNIGPVLDALSDALGATTVLTTPSSPEHLRTQYLGHLFVGGVLLSESHMRNHPVTPMTDSFLPRVLGAQTKQHVALIDLHTVRSGIQAVTDALAHAAQNDERYVLADATESADLLVLAQAATELPLIAGAAGLAGAVAATVAAGSSRASGGHEDDLATPGPAAVLAGSCSARTLEQNAVMKEAGRPAYRLDALEDQDPGSLAAGALAWYDTLPAGDAPLIYSSLEPEQLKQVQETLGAQRSSEILEDATGRIAQGLIARGVTRLVCAGGETSGSIVSALRVSGGLIGAEAAPGVPWVYTTGDPGVALLLKSGNFGEPDLFLHATRP